MNTIFLIAMSDKRTAESTLQLIVEFLLQKEIYSLLLIQMMF